MSHLATSGHRYRDSDLRPTVGVISLVYLPYTEPPPGDTGRGAFDLCPMDPGINCLIGITEKFHKWRNYSIFLLKKNQESSRKFFFRQITLSSLFRVPTDLTLRKYKIAFYLEMTHYSGVGVRSDRHFNCIQSNKSNGKTSVKF